MRFSSNRLSAALRTIRNRDIYGQPITLNYAGDDTFKTVPGGLLSIVLLVLVTAYTLLKGYKMVDREDWLLV